MNYPFIICIVLIILLGEFIMLDMKVTWTSAFIEIITIFFGVLGGFYASKKIEADKLIRKFIGSLETIDAELQFNIEVLQKIIESFSIRPSLTDREKMTPDRIYKLLIDEEDFTSKFAEPLSDNAYIEVISTINEISNRTLFQRIVNVYKKTKVTKFVFQLTLLKDHDIGSYTEEQKKDFIGMADEHFNKTVSTMDALVKDLSSLREELQVEIRKLLDNISQKS